MGQFFCVNTIAQLWIHLFNQQHIYQNSTTYTTAKSNSYLAKCCIFIGSSCKVNSFTTSVEKSTFFVDEKWLSKKSPFVVFQFLNKLWNISHCFLKSWNVWELGNVWRPSFSTWNRTADVCCTLLIKPLLLWRNFLQDKNEISLDLTWGQKVSNRGFSTKTTRVALSKCSKRWTCLSRTWLAKYTQLWTDANKLWDGTETMINFQVLKKTREKKLKTKHNRKYPIDGDFLLFWIFVPIFTTFTQKRSAELRFSVLE